MGWYRDLQDYKNYSSSWTHEGAQKSPKFLPKSEQIFSCKVQNGRSRKHTQWSRKKNIALIKKNQNQNKSYAWD